LELHQLCQDVVPNAPIWIRDCLKVNQ
jgi:hypothetical protein